MKKTIQKIIVFIMIFSLTITMQSSSLIGMATPPKLSDISNHWAKNYIEELVNKNAISGYPDQTFKPDSQMSRAAFITVVMKALNITPVDNIYFDDTDKHWANGYICAAVDYGLLDVKEYYDVMNDKFIFNPDQNITRVEMAKVMINALGETYKALNFNGELEQFNDYMAIGEDQKGYINEAYQLNIISGYPDHSFGANKSATRAEACVMIVRMLNCINQNQGDITDGEAIYKEYNNSIVKLLIYDANGDEIATGSGFIITSDGKLVTNYHVIYGGSSVIVQFPNGTQKKVVAVTNYDRKLDVAVLKLEDGQYNPVRLGSDRLLNVGSTVYTMGYPLDQGLTISDGLISSKNYCLNHNYYVQISAPISSGNSGGPLIDKYGRVIGINARSNYYGQNINLSVPISAISDLLTNNENSESLQDVANPKSFSEDPNVSGDNLWSIIYELDTTSGSTTNEKVNINQSQLYYSKSTSTLRYNIQLLHEPFTKNNSYIGQVVIKNHNGYSYYYNYYEIDLSNTRTTELNLDLTDISLDYFYSGKYTIEFYMDGELIDTNHFYIQEKLDYSEYHQTAANLQVYDYEKYNETGDYVYIDQFNVNTTNKIGFKFDAIFSENFNEYRPFLYTATLVGPDDYSEKGYITVDAIEGENTVQAYYSFCLGEGIIKPGNYTLSIYYEDQLLAYKDIVGVSDLDMQVPSKDVLRIQIDDNLYLLDPTIVAYHGNTMELNVLNNIYEGLMRENNGKIEYGMAENYSISEDGKVYTFHLRDSKWSDGQDVRAQDFEYAWKRVINSDYIYVEYLFYYIKGVEAYCSGEIEAKDIGVKAVDDKTLQVTLEEPTPSFVSLVTQSVFMPLREDIVESGVEDWSINPDYTVTNGPFKLAEYNQNSFISIDKNEGYYNASHVKLKRIEFWMIYDDEYALNNCKEGKLDIINYESEETYIDENKLQDYNLDILSSSRLWANFCFYNFKTNVLKDINVRKALSLAINRQVISDCNTNCGVPATGIIPFGIYDSQGNEFRETAGDYGISSTGNIEEAKEYLAKAGYPNGDGFPELTIFTSYYFKELANEIVKNWRENLGINIVLEIKDYSDLSSAYETGDFDIGILGWLGDYSDTMVFFDLWNKNSNYNDYLLSTSWYENGESDVLNAYQQLIEQERQTTGSDRDAILYQMEKLLMENQAIMPLYYPTYTSIVSKDISNLQRSILGPWYFGNTSKE